MKALRDARDFEQVLAVRHIERTSAEMSAAQATKALHELEDRRARALCALAGDHLSWVNAASGASIDLYSARALSAIIEQKASDLRSLDHRVESAEDRLAIARTDLAQALGRFDATQSLASSAQRRLAKVREEVVLAEQGDRAAQRSAPR